MALRGTSVSCSGRLHTLLAGPALPDADHHAPHNALLLLGSVCRTVRGKTRDVARHSLPSVRCVSRNCCLDTLVTIHKRLLS